MRTQSPKEIIDTMAAKTANFPLGVSNTCSALMVQSCFLDNSVAIVLLSSGTPWGRAIVFTGFFERW